ncbi:DNA-3-methyladenine glycosylase I [Aureliella helgolandensis]|uniref:DNA-3-methyladenine glycosylase 1 n=1 Tax=Aureliella helgolandensis TaxID=2527968 RepID=A0A518G0M3_9BACT|nr:DNA-3-methyladenine glycosylase I [Aureliella helgolandensis]QDV22153.1 DNA-3-methyladenine glycosylase 1 [Aureliella helgolandensis]
MATNTERGLVLGNDSITRCWWCGSDAEYVDYHDTEWGHPVVDDVRLFEKICLEGFQAGLSWLTILRKREAFRVAFQGFEIEKVARYTERNVEQLLANAGIVRHRGKIEAAIKNARLALELKAERHSLAGYFWSFEPAKTKKIRSQTDVVATTAESQALSKDLKRRGWSFVGPTTCYAFMQAMGMVNDHVAGCNHWQTVDTLRRELKRP